MSTQAKIMIEADPRQRTYRQRPVSHRQPYWPTFAWALQELGWYAIGGVFGIAICGLGLVLFSAAS